MKKTGLILVLMLSLGLATTQAQTLPELQLQTEVALAKAQVQNDKTNKFCKNIFNVIFRYKKCVALQAEADALVEALMTLNAKLNEAKAEKAATENL